jgi:hypothetical protein
VNFGAKKAQNDSNYGTLGFKYGTKLLFKGVNVKEIWKRLQEDNSINQRQSQVLIFWLILSPSDRS